MLVFPFIPRVYIASLDLSLFTSHIVCALHQRVSLEFAQKVVATSVRAAHFFVFICRKECHCMLFLTPDNYFAGKEQVMLLCLGIESCGIDLGSKFSSLNWQQLKVLRFDKPLLKTGPYQLFL